MCFDRRRGVNNNKEEYELRAIEMQATPTHRNSNKKEKQYCNTVTA